MKKKLLNEIYSQEPYNHDELWWIPDELACKKKVNIDEALEAIGDVQNMWRDAIKLQKQD